MEVAAILFMAIPFRMLDQNVGVERFHFEPSRDYRMGLVRNEILPRP